MHTNLIPVLTAIFDRRLDYPSLAPAEERSLIAAARLGAGDAYVSLMQAYAPALRSAVGRMGFVSDRDESVAVAVEALISAVQVVPDGARLGGTLKIQLTAHFRAAHGTHRVVTVPDKIYQRYRSAMRAAEGDPDVAAGLASQYELSREAFHATHAACHGSAWDPAWIGDEAQSPWATRPDGTARDLAGIALGVLDSDERSVVRLMYGFDDYDPCNERVTADRLGLRVHEVRKLHTSALDKMRAASGVAS